MVGNLSAFDLTQLFNGNILDNILRILIILLEAVYLIYAFIITRQVKLMNGSFITKMGPLYSLLALLHFLGALALIIISLIAF